MRWSVRSVTLRAGGRGRHVQPTFSRVRRLRSNQNQHHAYTVPKAKRHQHATTAQASHSFATTYWNYQVLSQASRTTYFSSARGSVSKWLRVPRSIMASRLGSCQLKSLKYSIQSWFGILLLKFTLPSRRKLAKKPGRTHISSLQRQLRAM